MVVVLDTVHLDIWHRLALAGGSTLTYEGDYEDAEEDTQDVAQDVHQHDGDEGDGQTRLTLSLLALSTT